MGARRVVFVSTKSKCDFAALALTILRRLHVMLAGCYAEKLFSLCYPTCRVIAQPQAEELPAALGGGTLRPRDGECLFLIIRSIVLGVGVGPERAPSAREGPLGLADGGKVICYLAV